MRLYGLLNKKPVVCKQWQPWQPALASSI